MLGMGRQCSALSRQRRTTRIWLPGGLLWTPKTLCAALAIWRKGSAEASGINPWLRHQGRQSDPADITKARQHLRVALNKAIQGKPVSGPMIRV